MPPSFLSLIWQRWYPDNTAESRVESTFRSKATTARQLSQRTTSGTEKFFGIFHTIRVHKFLQITTEVFVHHIAQIGLVCFKQCTQFLQRKRGVKKYLTYLKLVQYTFLYILQSTLRMSVSFPANSSFHCRSAALKSKVFCRSEVAVVRLRLRNRYSICFMLFSFNYTASKTRYIPYIKRS